MAKYVFILGAGASAHTGAPLSTNFLDVAERIYSSGRAEFREEFKAVFEAIYALQPVNHKTEIDLDNLEDVFAAFEMAELIQRVPTKEIVKETGDRLTLTVALAKVIAETLVRSVRFPLGAGNSVLQDRVYSEFSQILAGLNQNFEKPAVITFNYDVSLDHAMECLHLKPNYGFDESEGVPLLKLHGSLNWFECGNPECSGFLPVPILEICRRNPKLIAGRDGTGLSIGPVAGFHHCSKGGWVLKDTPVIVPPTWNKGKHHERLAAVWARAARELSEAENIFICGYSFPETDAFVKYLLSLGLVGAARVKRFWVINPQPQVSNRFQKFLGKGLERAFQKKDIDFNIEFETGIRLIKNELIKTGELK